MDTVCFIFNSSGTYVNSNGYISVSGNSDIPAYILALASVNNCRGGARTTEFGVPN